MAAPERLKPDPDDLLTPVRGFVPVSVSVPHTLFHWSGGTIQAKCYSSTEPSPAAPSSTSLGSTTAKRTAPDSLYYSLPYIHIHAHTRTLSLFLSHGAAQQDWLACWRTTPARRSLPIPRKSFRRSLYRHSGASSIISISTATSEPDHHNFYRRTFPARKRRTNCTVFSICRHRIGLKGWLYVGKSWDTE
ncbi:hypothetical protein ATANTOWER_028551 [Ataeniobius toweri]|uniref:Uncharacterized protein n=1 Tax=Ataeniobius toweri TaxID=208326 RepID=A0ABU7AUC4_9TELE|nr:hypothetical protein [Ataeniobius toweri]